MAAIELRNLSKSFGDVPAVRGINLAIADGEFIVLVGPSGCGKTTTLRMIAGLESVSGGVVAFDGEEVNRLPPKGRDIAMVFQSYALYPHMTVFANMAFGLRLSGVDRAQIGERVRAAAELLNISELLRRRPRELSGGQRQRVAMGRAIVRQPRAFLFDEPLSNLDANLRAQMRVEIKRLHGQLRTTVVYVTHDQVEAMTLADRIVVMRDGEIVQSGPPEDVYRKPVDRFVAGFIGAPKMNFLPSRLQGEYGALRLRVGDGEAEIRVPASDALAGRIGEEVEIGLRPEHLSMRTSGEGVDPGRSFPFPVEVVEPLGAETLVFTTISGAEVVARCDPDLHPRPGDQLTAVVDTAHLHLIDPASGRVLAR